MEASDPTTTVEPLQPAFVSRPGPVGGNGDEVFQASNFGKYTFLSDHSIADLFPASSLSPDQRSLGCSATGIMEASDPPATVEPLQPAFVSRPSPVCGSGDEVFQIDFIGNSMAANQSCLSSIRVYYQNVGGMNACIDEYLLACSDECFDVIAFTETWLNDCTLSVQVLGKNYEVFRTDRSSSNSTKSTGGGVLVGVHRRLKAQLIQCTSGSCVEQVWVQIKLASYSTFFCAVYFPPDRTRDLPLIDAHLLSLEEICSYACPVDEILIVGDFNFPNLKWQPASNGFLFADPSQSSFHAGSISLLDRYSTNLMRQFNHVTNENNKILDLCFSSKSDSAPKIAAAPVPMVKYVKHHPPLCLEIEASRQSHSSNVDGTVRYDYKKADYRKIIDFLSNIDWSEVLDKDDANLAVQTFSNILTYAIDHYVPKRLSNAFRQAPWQTTELKRLKSSKRSALKKYSKHGGYALRANYVHINSLYKRTAKRCYARYLRNVQNKLKSDPKSFWKYVNDQRKESNLPSSMVYGISVGTNLDEICQLFSEKFSSVFSNEVLSPNQIAQAAMNVPVSHQLLDTISVDEDSKHNMGLRRNGPRLPIS
ncbi:uncharacterized protein LOC131426653 [Malaya genurostris]|uniref:uncharacterized protein LOC131426653 n=1 Tax=Malaya genurostris TaxID=325434 RepID=UPI0026F3DA44|nr:uncharacterized protein LOC131426653 [Malaya genurostris]